MIKIQLKSLSLFAFCCKDFSFLYKEKKKWDINILRQNQANFENYCCKKRLIFERLYLSKKLINIVMKTNVQAS